MADLDALTTDPSNADQLRTWDGDEGAYWAEHAEHFDRSLAAYHGDFVAATAVRSTERVLDVGCGNGQTTLDAARAAGAGSVLGVDLSSQMIEHARRRAARERIENVVFEQVDAQIHSFASTWFDVAISRFGAMFFGDPVAAFSNIGQALRPDGRLVLLAWQPLSRNEWIREARSAFAAGRDLPVPPPDSAGPFSLSDPDRVEHLLTAAGFHDVELADASHDMWIGDDADQAVGFVLGLLGWMLDDLDEDGRHQALAALRASAVAHERAEGVIYGSAAWIIRARRPG
jgi:SAM-dependent methyltransferase